MRTTPVTIQNFFDRLQEFKNKRSTDFWLFESSIWLHMFASAIISIFIPVLMLEIGFNVQEVILFYILYHLFDIPASYLGKHLTIRYGAKFTIILATLFTIVFYLIYSQVETWVGLALMALFYALYDGLYYVASAYIFTGSTKDPENTGENIGILYLVIRSAFLLGPLLGSALVLLSGGTIVIVVSAVILFFIMSIIPLMFLQEIETKPEHNTLSFKEFFNNKKEIKNHITHACFKIHEGVEYVIFPMFIFITFKNLSSVAILAILVPVVSLVFSYAAGHIKRSHREKVIILGAGLLALVWVVRLFGEGQILLYGTVVAAGIFGLFISIPLDSNMFLRGSQRGALSASLYRNVISMTARAILFIVLYFCIAILQIPFAIAVFVLLAIMGVNYGYLKWRLHQPGVSTSIIGLPKV